MGEGYIEVSVGATAETAEALTDFVFSEGALGVVTEDLPNDGGRVVVRASFRGASSIDAILGRLIEYQRQLKALGFVDVDERVEMRPIVEQDWGKAWKEHFRPFAVGKQLVIAPSWADGPFTRDQTVIRIDPGMSFGTGHHATTRMCLEALELLMGGRPAIGKRRAVLDVGTGTGILAIAAAVLGAECVIAIDTDPDACEAARRNFALNAVSDRIRLSQGGVETLSRDLRCDVIVANLDSKGLCGAFEDLSIFLRPQGHLVASGILLEEEAAVAAAGRAVRLGVRTRRSDGEWLCLTLAPDRQGSVLAENTNAA